MAQETMVDDATRRFYDAVGQLVLQLDKEHGPLYLAMVVQFKDRPSDDWILLLGSRRLADSRAQSMNDVAAALGAKLQPEYARKIRRIGIVEQTDPVFLSIAQTYGRGLSEKAFTIEHCSFDGIDVARAALFVSRIDPGPRHKKPVKRGRSRRG